MILNEAIDEMIDNIEEVSSEVDSESIMKMLDMLIDAKNVFIIGLGRSGLVARAFAMRLMHLGISVYVVGETITPAIYEDDCLLAISGSGETSFIISTATTSKNRNANIIAVTSYEDSTLGRLSDLIIHVKGRTKIDSEKDYIKRQINGRHQPLAPLGTLFEITTLVFLEGVIAEMMHKMGKTEDDLKARHTVLE
jgi:6-phospho-3-hexuloisomerase